MNCPKCNATIHTVHYHGQPEAVRIGCNGGCGWQSDTLEDLALVSPSYRLAELEAQGAEPGWYGPDFEACKSIRLESGELAGVVWHDAFLDIEKARICGFVEVPHE